MNRIVGIYCTLLIKYVSIRCILVSASKRHRTYVRLFMINITIWIYRCKTFIIGKMRYARFYYCNRRNTVWPANAFFLIKLSIDVILTQSTASSPSSRSTISSTINITVPLFVSKKIKSHIVYLLKIYSRIGFSK